LWAGTEDAGVIRYHEGRFTSYGKEQGLTSLYAAYLTDDVNGNLFVFLINDQVMRWSAGKFVPTGPSGTTLRELVTTHPQARRVPCARDPDNIRCLGYGTSWTVANGLPSVNLAASDGVADKNGALWIALADRLAKTEKGKVVRVYTERDGLPGSPIAFVTGLSFSLLTKDRTGAIWKTDIETMRS